jgi:hypothetical protein
VVYFGKLCPTDVCYFIRILHTLHFAMFPRVRFFSPLTLLLSFHISVNFRVYRRLKHSALFTVTDAMFLLLDVNAFSIIKINGNAASHNVCTLQKINNKDG